MSSNLFSKRAFTLIEMLIVVAIIAILIAIGIPIIAKNLDTARVTADGSNERTAWSSFTTEASDDDSDVSKFMRDAATAMRGRSAVAPLYYDMKGSRWSSNTTGIKTYGQCENHKDSLIVAFLDEKNRVIRLGWLVNGEIVTGHDDSYTGVDEIIGLGDGSGGTVFPDLPGGSGGGSGSIGGDPAPGYSPSPSPTPSPTSRPTPSPPPGPSLSPSPSASPSSSPSASPTASPGPTDSEIIEGLSVSLSCIPESPEVGKEFTITANIANSRTDADATVAFSALLPTGVTAVGTAPDSVTVPKGGSREVTFKATASSVGAYSVGVKLAAGSVDKTERISVTVAEAAPDPAITLDGISVSISSSNTNPDLSSLFKLTVSVSNGSSVSKVADVSINAPTGVTVSGASSWSGEPIAAGETREFTAWARASASGSYEIVGEASIGGSSKTGAVSIAVSSTGSSDNPLSKVSVSLTYELSPGESELYSGDEFMLHMKVTNGTGAAIAPSVTLSLAGPVSIVDADGGSMSGGAITWNSSIPGSSMTRTVIARADGFDANIKATATVLISSSSKVSSVTLTPKFKSIRRYGNLTLEALDSAPTQYSHNAPVKASWVEVRDAGGNPVDGYIVERRPVISGVETEWMSLGTVTDLSYVDNRTSNLLTPNVEYEYRVTAFIGDPKSGYEWREQGTITTRDDYYESGSNVRVNGVWYYVPSNGDAKVQGHKRNGDIRIDVLDVPATIVTRSDGVVHNVTGYMFDCAKESYVSGATPSDPYTARFLFYTYDYRSTFYGNNYIRYIKSIGPNVSSIKAADNGVSSPWAGNITAFNCMGFDYVDCTRLTGSSGDIQAANGYYYKVNLNTVYSGFNNLVACAPDAIGSRIQNLDYAFYKVSALKYVPDIPSNVTSAYSAYAGTGVVSPPKIYPGVTKLAYSFSDCKSLTVAPDVPDMPGKSVDMSSMFRGCSKLQKAGYIGKNVTSIYCAYGSCSALTEAPEIPNSVITMAYAFDGCTSLVNPPVIKWGTNLGSMAFAFMNCSKLESIPAVIPSSVTNLNGVFQYCTALRSAHDITLDAASGSVSYSNAFGGCLSLPTRPKLIMADKTVTL